MKMKLFSNMYRKRHAKSAKSITSHSTFDLTSLQSIRSLEETLQVTGADETPPENKEDAPSVPIAVEEEPAAGDAQATESEAQPSATTSEQDDDEESVRGAKGAKKRDPADTYEARERREKEEAMMNLWRRTALPKKLPIPTRYPSYLKEPPELSYEETASYIRRKMYNDSRIKMSQEEPPKMPITQLKRFEPKSNKTVQLRNTYIKRDPVVSQYFSDHYNAYKKPPFRHTNVKFCN